MCSRIMCGEQSGNAENSRASFQKSFSFGQTVTTSVPISREPIQPLKLVSVLGHHRPFLSSGTERREEVGASLGVFVVLVFLDRGG